MLEGLIVAAHTPFDRSDKLNLSAVPKQAAHFRSSGVKTVFVCGSTGEFASMSKAERLDMVDCWSEAAKQENLQYIVHVGANCLRDSQEIAARAESAGALGIASLAPCYFKPDIETLVAWCEEIASSAPTIPFYYYDIPSMTGAHHSMPHMLRLVADRIPNFTGIKYTNADLMSYQRCLHTMNGRFDMLWGIDESLLSALALGAKGAVGSSYNFAAPVYRKLLEAFQRGDMEAAQEQQMRSVRLIALLTSYGYMAAAKATMGFLGVDVGQPRLPNQVLSEDQCKELEKELKALGFFDWIAT